MRSAITSFDIPLSTFSGVHFSSATDEWATPQPLFDELDRIFGGFTLDPCATPANAKCPDSSPAPMTVSFSPGAGKCS